jgi:hypothetical protein
MQRISRSGRVAVAIARQIEWKPEIKRAALGFLESQRCTIPYEIAVFCPQRVLI